MKLFQFITVTFIALTTIGCSTITQTDSQSVELTATYQGNAVEPICIVKNNKYSQEVKAPTKMLVRKSNEDLIVVCKKEGMPDGLLKAVSHAAISLYGNIVAGGVVGALVDHEKGSGYKYPDQLPVKMGESVVVKK